MRRTRGFKLKIKLLKIFKSTPNFNFNLPPSSNPFSNLFSLATASFSRRLGYGRLERRRSPPPPPPKGYLAVHVGGPEDQTETHLVPVIYFNHPMFGKLLQAAERIYGFDYPGRIVIPVGVSEFEEVRNCIAAADHSRSRRRSGGCRRRLWGK
ncbi:Auxin-responsive protein SAUR36, partial [Cucurbita argyrosperma subsp. argyrosperma]